MPILPTVPGLVLALVLLAVLAFRFWRRGRDLTRRFATVLDVEKERDRVAKEQRKLRREVDQQRTRWKVEFETTIKQLERLTNELDRVRDAVEMQSFGLYEPELTPSIFRRRTAKRLNSGGRSGTQQYNCGPAVRVLLRGPEHNSLYSSHYN